MRNRCSPLVMFLVVCFIVSLFSIRSTAMAEGNGVAAPLLYNTEYTLPSPIGITADLSIGRLPEGVTLAAEGVSVSSPASAKFSFTSDDGSEKDWSYRNLFADRGVACTIPVVENYVTGRTMTVQISQNHLLTLQNDYGYEIGSHSYDHVKLSELSSEDLIFQLTESKRSLSEMGLRIHNFYLPFGAYTDKVLDEAYKIYRSVRTSRTGVNAPLDKRQLKAFWLDGGNFSLTDAKAVVDSARANHQFVIFGFHSGVASKAFMDETVAPLMDYIQTFDDTQILTVDKSLDRLENVITKDMDYRLVDGEIVLDRFFLRSLSYGENTLTLRFSDGTEETLHIHVDRNAPLPHRITLTDSSLSPGTNRLDANQTILFKAALETSLAGECTSTASIGTVTATGILEGGIYTYTFSTNDIPDGSYDKLVIESHVGAHTVIAEQPLDLVIEKTITEGEQLISLAVTTPPAKLTYFQNEALNLSGMEVTAYYKDGSSAAVGLGWLAVTGSTATTGLHSITVAYGGFSTTFAIQVNARTVTALEVTTPPRMVTYYQGEPLSLSGLVVTATKPDGTTEMVRNYTLSGYDANKLGEQWITVELEGFTDTFMVTVRAVTLTSIEVSVNPTKVRYTEGDAFDSQGLAVSAQYSDGHSAKITGYTLSGYSSTPGIKTIRVSYQSFTTEFNVTVVAKQLTSIKVTTLPNRRTYVEDFEIDLTGMVVTAYYNNGSSAVITNYYLGDFTTTPGAKTIPVYYSGQETSFTITVTSKSSLPASITSSRFTCNAKTGFLSKVGAGTTVSSLVAGINEKTSIKAFRGNAEVSGNTLAATGMSLKLMQGNTVKQTITVVITGDTNGDGKVSLTDFVQLKSHLLAKSKLTWCYEKSGDVNGDGKITLTDFLKVKAHLLGKETIQPQS